MSDQVLFNTNNAAPTLPAMIARLCCITFVDGLSFSSVASKYGSAEDGLASLSTEVGSTVVESFWAFSLLSNIGCSVSLFLLHN